MKQIFAILLSLISLNSFAQEIAGNVLDEHREPFINCVVQVFRHGVLKGGNVTDFDGNYIIKPLDSGSYDLVIYSLGYDSMILKDVPVLPGMRTTQNAKLTPSKKVFRNVNICTIGRRPLVDKQPVTRLPVPGISKKVTDPKTDILKIEERPVAEISGKVLDEKSQPVPGTKVLVYKDKELKGNATTDIAGKYAVTSLDPGLLRRTVFRHRI